MNAKCKEHEMKRSNWSCGYPPKQALNVSRFDWTRIAKEDNDRKNMEKQKLSEASRFPSYIC